MFAICCGDSQLELSDLSGDLLFRGKHLDFAKLQELKIIPKKEDEGSEWDTFLDEWEAAAEEVTKSKSIIWKEAFPSGPAFPCQSHRHTVSISWR